VIARLHDDLRVGGNRLGQLEVGEARGLCRFCSARGAPRALKAAGILSSRRRRETAR